MFFIWLINTVNHFGPHPAGGWICFIMLVLALLAAATKSGHIANLVLADVVVGIAVGYALGF